MKALSIAILTMSFIFAGSMLGKAGKKGDHKHGKPCSKRFHGGKMQDCAHKDKMATVMKAKSYEEFVKSINTVDCPHAQEVAKLITKKKFPDFVLLHKLKDQMHELKDQMLALKTKLGLDKFHHGKKNHGDCKNKKCKGCTK